MTLDLKSLVASVTDAERLYTPAVYRWLLQNPDGLFSYDTLDRVIQTLQMARYSPVGTFSASSAGTCPRRQVLDALGTQRLGANDPALSRIFMDGKWRHLRLQAMGLESGALDGIEISVDWPLLHAKGTLDGVGEVPDSHPNVSWRGKTYGVEFKGVNTHQFVRLDTPMPHHLAQVTRYFLLGGFDLFSIVYEDKNTNKLNEWVIEANPLMVMESQRELEDLNRSLEQRSLPMVLPDCLAQKGIVFKECPFGGAHGPCLSAGSWPS